MAEFSKIDHVYTPRQKLSAVEMLRAVKFAIASEFDAIQIYQLIMESTDEQFIKNVLSEIVRDEKRHVGGLSKLLQILSPEDTQEYKHGEDETIENING